MNWTRLCEVSKSSNKSGSESGITSRHAVILVFIPNACLSSCANGLIQWNPSRRDHSRGQAEEHKTLFTGRISFHQPVFVFQSLSYFVLRQHIQEQEENEGLNSFFLCLNWFVSLTQWFQILCCGWNLTRSHF